MFSDYSSDATTTYSADEQIDKYLRHEREKQLNIKDLRHKKFQKLFSRKHERIFNLPGLSFRKFTHQKIKFSFQPSLVYEHISKKIVFYCSLKYLERYHIWTLKREPMPGNTNWLLYPKFFSSVFGIQDSETEIFKIIFQIYLELRRWSEKEILYRRKKYKRFTTGELDYVDIDSTDEELYFSTEEKQLLHIKRQTVLRRMIPPQKKRRRKQQLY